MKRIRTAVVIPAGPGDTLTDTVESVLQYVAEPRAVVIVDDTGGESEIDAVRRLSPDVEVIPSPFGAWGNRGGLWVKLAAGYRHVAGRYDFELLLRLDADALLLGSGLESAALARFEAEPGTGMLGSYRIGPDGRPRDFGPAARILAAECGVRGLRKPRLRALLRELRSAASFHGYVPGEHPLGGAYLHSAEAVRAIEARGWLDLPALAHSGLSEDHLFALLTVGAGLRIADFGGPDDPLALRWRGLPSHPAELLARRKLVTHSVRGFGDLDERSIRRRFARRRREGSDELPSRVDKPWGYEIWYAHTEHYAGKILHVNEGCRLSVQFHERKDESNYVLSGRLRLTTGPSADRLSTVEIGPGETWRNVPGVVHAIEAIEDAEVLEVSTPELDDVVRLEDRYGRRGTSAP